MARYRSSFRRARGVSRVVLSKLKKSATRARRRAATQAKKAKTMQMILIAGAAFVGFKMLKK